MIASIRTRNTEVPHGNSHTSISKSINSGSVKFSSANAIQLISQRTCYSHLLIAGNTPASLSHTFSQTGILSARIQNIHLRKRFFRKDMQRAIYQTYHNNPPLIQAPIPELNLTPNMHLKQESYDLPNHSINDWVTSSLPCCNKTLSAN